MPHHFAMKDGPDIARVASLIGDPARANMLAALMAGKALTSGELAREAGVSPPTASSHLQKLSEAGLIASRKQGRHQYWRLAGAEIAGLIEGMMGFAAQLGALRTRTGPRDAALRKSRICYDHLAGDFGVMLFDAALREQALTSCPEGLGLTKSGKSFFACLDIDTDELASRDRVLCRECLDWSARRSHLAGALGAACLSAILGLGWARRDPRSRIIAFSPDGERRFLALFDNQAGSHAANQI